jgi:hypothetical protein
LTYERLAKQIQFIAEVDKLKQVLRRTSPIGVERRENSAEHSWQVVLTALLLEEHANEPLNMLRVVQMLAIHDTVEIDVGDTSQSARRQLLCAYSRFCQSTKGSSTFLYGESSRPVRPPRHAMQQQSTALSHL